MKNKLFFILFLFLHASVFSQVVTTTIVYSGAQLQGCSCLACNIDNWCINSQNCGTASVCDSRTFTDPVPAGNIIIGVTVTYFGAGCSATAEPTYINNVLIGAAPNDGDCSCGACTQYPTTNNYTCPIGLPSYNYGGVNTLKCCPDAAFCPQKVVITFHYTSVSVAPTAATASPNPSCGGTSVTLSKTGGSLGTGAAWKWYSGSCGGTLVGTGASITVTPSTTTTYFVRGEGGSCGNTACVQVTVTVGTPSVAPTSITANPDTTCGGPTTLAVVGGSLGTGGSWKWYSGSCGGTPEGTGTTITVSPTTNITYFVRAESNCGNTTCVSKSVTVHLMSSAIATPSASTICSGTATSIALSSSTLGTNFNWTVSQTGVSGATNNSGSTITQTLSTTGAVPGTAVYTITPTANGCSGSPITVTITVNPVPVITATPSSQTICTGPILPISLSSTTSGTTFSWTVAETAVSGGSNSSGATIHDSLVVTGNGNGTATYTINAAANNCNATPLTATIAVAPKPSVTATPTSLTICSGTATSIVLSSLTSGASFSWTVNQTGVSGATAGSNSTISQVLTLTGTNPGTVTYTITPSANGCTGTPITVTVTINPSPVITATPSTQTICTGATTTPIILSSTFMGTTFSWTVAETGVSGGSNTNGSSISDPLISTGSGSGIATYAINGTTTGCSANPITATVTVNPKPTVTATPTALTICSGATASIALSSTTPGTNFSWTAVQTGVSGAISGTSSTISQSLNLTGTSQGNVIYTITPSANSCNGTPVTSTITVSPLPVANSTSVIITPANCGANGTVSGIIMTTGTSPFLYQWHDSLNALVGNGNASLSNVGPGSYSVTITDANNCTTSAGPFSVHSTQPVVAAFTPNPLSGAPPLTVNFTNNSTGAATYLWSFGNGDTSFQTSPSYVYTSLGTYTVCLKAINIANCNDTACSTINVFINTVFIVPNIFTPNDDGINDVFTVQAVGLKTLNAEIFNRWGEKEYEWHTTNGGWDGRTASGVRAAAGTYYYIISATAINGKTYFEKGTFSLVRGK